MTECHVHILNRPDEADLAHLESHLTDGIVLSHGNVVAERAQILVGGRPTREQLAAPRLESLIVPWVGLPSRTRDLLSDFPHLTVHNLHHNAAMVAELAVGLLLATAKFIVPLDRALRADDWTPRFQPARSLLLSGRTCLVLGYGAIGQRVARVCHAFGMRVIATRRGPPTSDGIAEVHPPRAMPDLLPQAHALIVCLPLTPETEGLIGANELRLLPDKSILVNIGRGPIVDEDALYTALVENTIGGAGLDVWYNYPADEASYGETAPSQHRFGDLDNVVLSPHRGGKVIGTEAMRMQGMAELLNCAASGRPIPNQIDPGRGY